MTRHLPSSQFSLSGCLVVCCLAVIVLGSFVVALALVVRVFLTVSGIG